MDREQLREKVNRAYSEAAERPGDEHPFPVGRRFAESVGYPPELLADLPALAVDAFCGVSNVAVFADILEGAVVLDLGCGAGLDSLIAAGRAGTAGRVIGVDFSASMVACTRRAAAEAGVETVKFYEADAERLPVDDGSIDVALVNGVFNLNPARDEIFRELARVVRPGGVVFGAELILREPLPADVRRSEANWFA